MTQIIHISLRADESGTLELVCERSASESRIPEVRSFVGKDEFGLLVDGLEPNERVALFFERDSETPSPSERIPDRE